MEYVSERKRRKAPPHIVEELKRRKPFSCPCGAIYRDRETGELFVLSDGAIVEDNSLVYEGEHE